MKKKIPVQEPDDTPVTRSDRGLQAEKPLRESGDLFHTVFDRANDAILLHTLTTDMVPGRFIDANLVACRMLGYTRDELLTMGPLDIVPPELHPQLAEIVRQAQGTDTFLFETKLLRKDGTTAPVESSGRLVEYDGKKVWISHIRDISERKKAEADLARLNRALRMRSESNRVLVHATDETMLMNEICRIAVEFGGYRMAWIGFAEQDEAKTVRPVAHAGFESGYIETATITWEDSARGRGPGGTAIRTGQPALARNITTDPAFAPWMTEANLRGYQSVIALPLTREGRTFGALGIYASEADAFDAAEVEILRELADDLSFGIAALRTRARRARAEEALRESEEKYRALFEESFDGLFITSPAGRILDMNKKGISMFGYGSKEEILRLDLEKDVYAYPPDRKRFLAMVDAQGSAEYEVEVKKKSGERMITYCSLIAVKDETGLITSYRGIIRDITKMKHAEEALRKSEEKFRNVFDWTNDAIMLHTLTTGRAPGRFIEVNLVACRMLGYSRDELLAMGPPDIVPPELHQQLGDIIRQAQTKETFLFETRFLRKDGTTVPVESSGHLVTYEGKRIWISHIRDITNRKHVEVALMESEQRYRSLFENANEGILFADIGTKKFVHANPAICRMLGYSQDELITLGVADIHPKESLDHVVREFQKLATGETGVATAIPCLKKDGTIRMMDIASSRVLMQGKMYLVGIFSDITERKKAEESLRESHAKYKQLVENISDVILTLDLNGTVTYISPVVQRLFGYTVPDVVGQHFSRFVHPEDLSRVLEGFRHRVAGEYGANEFRLLTKDGHERVVRTSQTPIVKDETVTGFNYIMTDYTDRRKAEDELRKSEAYVKNLLESLDVGFMIIDPATHAILDVNPVAVNLIGEAKEKIVGSECHRYVCPAARGSCPITDLHQTVDHSERVLIRAGHQQCPIIKTVIPLTLNGKPVLLESFIDITVQKEAEATLVYFNRRLQQGIEEQTAIIRESELRHRLLFESSRDAIMTLEPPDWHFTSCNPATVAMFRTKDETDFTTKAPWELSPEHQPDGRPSYEKAKEMIGTAMRDGSNYFEWTHRRLTGEDFPATVLLTRFAWKGKEILQATVRDITERKRADDKIRASLEEKVLLLREIHHRVKNNLQIIISLTNLQMRQIDDERLKQVMAETQNRVRAMSLVHEKLYQSEDISRIDLGSYTRFLVTHLFSYYGIDFRQVVLHIDIGKIMLSINTAIPLGLIINELVSNALKHAFPHGRTGSLSIIVREEKTTLHLSVIDDGVGLAADSDWRHAESLGLRLVISLVDQLDGTIELDRSAGTAFVIVVKEKE